MNGSNFVLVCTVPKEGPPIYFDGSKDYWESMDKFNRKKDNIWEPHIEPMPVLVEPKPRKRITRRKYARREKQC